MKNKNIYIILFPILALLINAYSIADKSVSFSPNDSIKIVSSNDITEKEIFLHIEYLASDELGGRKAGTQGDLLAREYLSGEFERYGLKPAVENGYFQEFEIEGNAEFGKDNYLNFSTKAGDKNYKINDEFTPLSNSSNGKVTGSLFFTGFGIKSDNYNDFKDASGKIADLTGKIAVIFKGVPETDSKQFKDGSKYKQLMYKLAALKSANASAVIIINSFKDNNNKDIAGNDNLSQKSGIPVIFAKREILSEVFLAYGFDLKEIEKNICEDQMPDSFELKDVKASISVDLVTNKITAANIAGFLEGSDPVLKNETIVVGAHFDHLGTGKTKKSTAPDEDGIFNGADDNASGTAGVLELAQKFCASKENLKRSILFVCFAAEEEGLLGSAHFANSELMKKYNVVGMINLDMLGRMENNSFVISGTGTSENWVPIITEKNKNYNFNISMNSDGYGGSDHNSFTVAKVPVLFFFTGLHGDYHKPTDDFWKINTEGEAKLLNYIYDVTLDIANVSGKISFVETTNMQQQNKGNIKVTLGVVPDFAGGDNGFKISGVKPNGPAEKAGMQKGDVIIKFNGNPIKNIYDYTAALGTVNAGDEVEVVYIRNNEEITIKVKL